MQANATRAGGCLWTLCILGGFTIGLLTDATMRGVIFGTIAGGVAALLLWLIDRRRG